MRNHRLAITALAAALAATGSPVAGQDKTAGQAQASSAVAPSSDQNITVVTVLGKLSKRPPATIRRLDRRSASSCAYDFNATATEMMDDYLDHFHGRGRANDGTEAAIVEEGDTPAERAFSDTSPYGDAARDGNVAANIDTALSGSGCRASDYAAAAGRNAIARKDKTIDQGYALYDKGDYAGAMEQFKISWRKVGWPEAALMIGDMYLHGQGTPANPGEAAAWYTKLANEREKKDDRANYDPKAPEKSTPKVDAYVRLARLYMEGLGVSKDPKAARTQYQKAEELGFIPGRYALGRMHLTGFGGPVDVHKGLALLLDAAEHGYAPAQWTLARVYDDGKLVPRDAAKALEWYQQSAFNPRADDKKPHALLALARMYDTGKGVKADPAKALAYYKSAAVAGHPAAQNALATYFYEGGQVKQDLALARKLFIAAASQGDGDAMKNAGVMLFKGEGGGADLVQSYVWLRLAEQVGDAQAPAMAKLVETRLTAEQRVQADAVLKPKPKG